ncbi:subtilase family protein [Dokdonia sp. Hel_I_63]|nr:peptidase S8 and S53 subtilisin kexin sedolisin [Dokdonia sp. 4H-3-7-5]TVZ21632.1 subtilase family protein [Dokdonia sp. Hel_I_63]
MKFIPLKTYLTNMMNLQHTKSLVIAAMAATFLASCETPSALVTVPVENVDSNPLKVSALTESEKQAWSSRDLRTDTIPGMSVDRTYAEILPGKSGQQVIVAVIDSGIDINHEDLKGRIWTNPKEIAGNGKDDDNNGYIDDIHGWNFLGDVGAEQLEFVRIIKRFESEFAGKTLATIPASQKDIFLQYQKAKAEYDEKVAGAQRQKTQYEQIASQLKSSHPAIVKALGKEDYTQADLATIKNPSAEMQNHIGFITQMFQYTESIPDFMKNIDEGVEYFTGQLEANYNKTADFRKVLGDNPYDITDTKYGNNNVYGPEPDGAKHGTHVAGIIAATRNNGKGMNGVANSNIKIMAVRAVPDGDEYDKDIALAIRYAVDNGAKVINTSFGKYYAQNPEWVYDAIKYAAKNDVLIVNAAGNEGLSLDDPANRVYPNDQLDNVTEMADTFLTIGALAPKYGSQLLANFSNYGKSNVDVFAPGVDIYSTTPEDTYEYLGGTSMAAPNTAGVAAMLRSYYPKLSANEVKNIIMKSGLTTNTSVILGGDTEKQARFNEVSKSGEMVNMYNAFKLAELQK